MPEILEDCHLAQGDSMIIDDANYTYYPEVKTSD